MMWVVENQPQPIWDQIKKTFGKKFFNKQIEADFGITTDILKDLNEKYEKRVKNHKERSEMMIFKLT